MYKILTLYKSPNCPQQDMIECLRWCREQYGTTDDVILLGDFNADCLSEEHSSMKHTFTDILDLQMQYTGPTTTKRQTLDICFSNMDLQIDTKYLAWSYHFSLDIQTSTPWITEWITIYYDRQESDILHKLYDHHNHEIYVIQDQTSQQEPYMYIHVLPTIPLLTLQGTFSAYQPTRTTKNLSTTVHDASTCIKSREDLSTTDHVLPKCVYSRSTDLYDGYPKCHNVP